MKEREQWSNEATEHVPMLSVRKKNNLLFWNLIIFRPNR